ncbi:MAG TPA: site-specific integrase [Desulfotomaculum sp.]|nr:MAG: Site-specific recombinase XerD [Desulfotomaculum sp. 46_80]HAG12059.1 site-specific integrase [Desulfotomaculum sp.]
MASIVKRGENSYRVTVSCGYNGTGEKLTKRKTISLDPSLIFKSPTPKQLEKIEKELQKQAALFEQEVETGLYLDGGKITFSDFVERWLKDYAEVNLAPKTLSHYKDLLTRILPAMGHIKLEKLQPAHLLQFYENLREKGIRRDVKHTAKPEFINLLKQKKLKLVDLSRLSRVCTNTISSVRAGHSITSKVAEALSSALKMKREDLFTAQEAGTLSGQTIRHHHRLISAILNTAVQWQCILSNPAARVKPPKAEKKEAAHFEEDTTEYMLSLLDNEPLKYKTMVYLAVYSGSRLGEIAGLEWADVDFKNNLLQVCRASQYLTGQGIFTKEPKNESSKRIMAMPPLVMDLLKKYKAWQNEERLKCGDAWDKNSDRLFTKWNGQPIFPTTPTSWFRKFRRRHNLPEVKFHGLRHTNASLLIGQGVDIQTVAKRLGHTKATTTTNIYSHFLRRPDREAADKLQNLFSKDKIKPIISGTQND